MHEFVPPQTVYEVQEVEVLQALHRGSTKSDDSAYHSCFRANHAT
ncbi:MAG: hypothetical protein QOH21_2138 [Acidobacteriota bacterium]|nr:hypothetical protein [Acidobacteriota bacterium]